MALFVLASFRSVKLFAGLLSSTVLSVLIRLPTLDVHGSRPVEKAKLVV